MEDSPKKAFLVGIRDEKTSLKKAQSLLRELEGLANTLELDIVAGEIVNLRERHPRYGMGTGKAEEISEKAKALNAECIIFDRDLGPSQQRNWEQLTGISAIDRQELIIQIFAARASTREASLQVNLAELNYSLPRLQHKYINLARQRGGRYGTRGEGETRLETDRRRVEQRINRLEKELEKVGQQRQLKRRQRERQAMPLCSLVGYTNAGKSSVLNALTGAGVLAEDKLFATLDPVSRRLHLPGGTWVLLVDTVGLIRRLPHNLINAFRSTLEEVKFADILINVLDASDEDVKEHYETTLSILRDLGADNIPMITLLNKIDKLESLGDDLTKESAMNTLLDAFPDAIPFSAIEGKNAGNERIKDLFKAMEKNLKC